MDRSAAIGIEPAPPIGGDRASIGDTFALVSGGMSYLFLFSVDAVRAFYGIDESVASKGIGSMSNLLAAAGWSIVHLVQRPDLVARVRAGDRALAERCALESIRLAQRSIMLREVLQPTTVDVGRARASVITPISPLGNS